MNAALEILVPHVPNITAVTHLRSTLLQSSLHALRERGHFDAWAAAIDPIHRANILEAVGPAWLPLEVGIAHYQACDALALPQQELLQIGQAVGSRVRATFLNTVTKTMNQTGVSLWTFVPQFGRLWGRLFMGGSAMIAKAGPKDVQLDLRGLSLTRFAYFRHAFSGLVRAALLVLGARTAYINVVRFQQSTHEFVLQAAWV